MRCWFLVAGFVAVVAYLAGMVTVPEGSSEPWKVRLAEVFMGLSGIIVS